MNSEKVKEIETALSKNRDFGFWYSTEKGEEKILMFEDILTLINELESENERLSNTEIGELIKENEELAKQCVKWSELDFMKRNKIKELKDRIAELEKERKEHGKNKFVRGWKLGTEEFAEMLKEKMTKGEYMGKNYKLAVFRDIDIDETLKEFIEK